VGKDTLAASEPYRFYICKRGAYIYGCSSYCVGANLHLTNSVSLSHALTHSLTFISNIYICFNRPNITKEIHPCMLL
jgi:hypothetical protein